MKLILIAQINFLWCSEEQFCSFSVILRSREICGLFDVWVGFFAPFITAMKWKSDYSRMLIRSSEILMRRSTFKCLNSLMSMDADIPEERCTSAAGLSKSRNYPLHSTKWLFDDKLHSQLLFYPQVILCQDPFAQQKQKGQDFHQNIA